MSNNSANPSHRTSRAVTAAATLSAALAGEFHAHDLFAALSQPQRGTTPPAEILRTQQPQPDLPELNLPEGWKLVVGPLRLDTDLSARHKVRVGYGDETLDSFGVIQITNYSPAPGVDPIHEYGITALPPTEYDSVRNQLSTVRVHYLVQSSDSNTEWQKPRDAIATGDPRGVLFGPPPAASIGEIKAIAVSHYSPQSTEATRGRDLGAELSAKLNLSFPTAIEIDSALHFDLPALILDWTDELDQDGNQRRVLKEQVTRLQSAELEGQHLVLIHSFNHCGPCLTALADIKEALREHGADNLTVIYFSHDPLTESELALRNDKLGDYRQQIYVVPVPPGSSAQQAFFLSRFGTVDARMTFPDITIAGPDGLIRHHNNGYGLRGGPLSRIFREE